MKNTTTGHITCPLCGGQDLQLDGIQSVRVIEDWTDGRRWNYEYPAKPSGQWITLEAHCCACDHEWSPALPQREDLPPTGELSPHASEPKEFTDAYKSVDLCY